MSYNWNWGVFLQPSASGDDTYLGWLFTGLKWTISLSLSAWVIALIVGSIVGVLRTVPNRWLSGFATGYVELFRNIPLLVQLFIWYFVLPELLPPALGDAFKQSNPLWQQFFSAMLCLGLFTSARVAEQVRSGINSLPKGAEKCRAGDGLHAAAGVPPCADADGLPHHHAAADFGVFEHLQELCSGHHHRPHRA
jgi:glutamate/aspartate transport system permease protein